MLLNQYNFLRFDDGTAANPADLPQAYIRERCQIPFMPIIVPGEDLAFYINTKYGYDYGDSLTMRFVNRYGVATDGGTVQYDDIDAGHYNIYTDFVIPALADGIYTIQILSSLGSLLLESNQVQVMNSDYENISALVQFRNEQNLYNVRYSVLPDFYQKFRLRITDVTGGDYEPNNQAYQSVTTGKYRDLVAVLQKVITFEVYFGDKYAQEAIACFLDHRTRIINEKEYAFKEGLTHDPITTMKVVKGTFKMYDQSFVTVNKCDTLYSS